MPEYTPMEMVTFIKLSEEALNAIPADKLYCEPFADGHAYYFVVSEKPLTLQHIPYLDAWRLSDDRIKRLTLKAVTRNIETRKLMASLFGSE